MNGNPPGRRALALACPTSATNEQPSVAFIHQPLPSSLCVPEESNMARALGVDEQIAGRTFLATAFRTHVQGG